MFEYFKSETTGLIDIENFKSFWEKIIHQVFIFQFSMNSNSTMIFIMT